MERIEEYRLYFKILGSFKKDRKYYMPDEIINQSRHEST
jgi:hypothetical protein